MNNLIEEIKEKINKPPFRENNEYTKIGILALIFIGISFAIKIEKHLKTCQEKN